MVKHKHTLIKDMEISYQGVFNFKEMISMLKSLFKRYDYDITEKSYEDSTKSDLENIKVNWECDNKLDDYNKGIIKLKFDLKNCKQGYVDGIRVMDGNFKLVIDAIVERDYEDKWGKSSFRKFIGAVYEKYISETKQDYVDKSVKKLVDNIKSEVRQYLKI